MRIAYLDCFSGIAGDMFLGALMGAGVPESVLQSAALALGLGANLQVETVDRSGISSIKVHVLENGEPAEASGLIAHSPAADDMQHQGPGSEFEHAYHPETQHEHKIGHAHDDAHIHGRSLSDIQTLIIHADLHEAVKSFATKVFDLLGHSEAKIHNTPVDRIHFHEVGAVDAIVDIVAASAGIHHLQIDAWHASAINVGGGTVDCAHGTFPVPAPAAADLLRGFPTYSAHVAKELVTPTGAAILRALQPAFGLQPAMNIDTIGYGAGTRNPANFPNVLRLSVGNAFDSLQTVNRGETVSVLEAALDDLAPQLIAYVAEKALADGALDVMLTPVIMKKGRPGTLLALLCRPEDSARFEQFLFSETSTLGVRIRQDRRSTLERRHVSVDTPFGFIRVKLGFSSGAALNIAPEYEDCKAAATKHRVSLKQVQQAAIIAYAKQTAS